MKLHIAENLRRLRKNADMTQEQLAAKLGVSPQSISKWECGDGYPDIELLPSIANYYKVTIDELMGNDEIAKREDIDKFETSFWHWPYTQKAWEEKLEKAKEYYKKYPNNFRIIDSLEHSIVKNIDKIDENYELLKTLHEKVIAECTDETIRRDSLHRMVFACSENDIEEWIGKSELEWSEAVPISELYEDRYFLRKDFEAYRKRVIATDLLIFMQYLGRNNMQYYGQENEYVFDDPKRTASWELHKIRLLESFDENGIVPDAWCGCYAEFTLKAACALVGCGRVDEGFDLLEKTFERYERWLKIPKGELMDVGDIGTFKGAKITKWDDSKSTDIHLNDDTEVWTPYLHLFWQLKGDICVAMLQWPWFDAVREEERYKELLERARVLAEIEKES